MQYYKVRAILQNQIKIQRKTTKKKELILKYPKTKKIELAYFYKIIPNLPFINDLSLENIISPSKTSKTQLARF